MAVTVFQFKAGWLTFCSFMKESIILEEVQSGASRCRSGPQVEETRGVLLVVRHQPDCDLVRCVSLTALLSVLAVSDKRQHCTL